MKEFKERERLQDTDKHTDEERDALVSEDSEDEKKEEKPEEDELDGDTIRVRGVDGTFMTLEEAMKLALDSEEQEV